jgi:CheY-like chemotaxis protein
MSECYSLERVDPEKLQGCVVVVEDSQMDQTIIKHFLRRTMLRVRPAQTIEAAKKICKEPCDLILCDFHLPDGDAVQFLSWLRAEGVHVPVIAVTCDASGPTRDRLRTAECDAFLAKPLTEDKLLRALGEFLIMDRGGAGGSSLSRDDPKAALIYEFVKEIETYRQKIADAVKQADAMTCYIICQQLKGTAPCLGFDTLAKVAERAGEQVAATMSTEESSRALQELLGACERALRNR